MVLPYIEGTTETIQRILKKYGVGSCVKPYQTLWQILVHLKDKIEHSKKTEVVYQIPCKNCNHSYVGETARKLETRVKEHRQEYDKATDNKYTRSTRKVSETEVNKSAITDHAKQCNHVIDWEGAKVIDSESDKYRRWIKEAIWIKKSPTMNRDKGAYQLSHVWTGLITTSPPSGK